MFKIQQLRNDALKKFIVFMKNFYFHFYTFPPDLQESDGIVIYVRQAIRPTYLRRCQYIAVRLKSCILVF